MAGNNGPKIVTNGLLFCIDAASSTPYPTSPISSGLVMWMDAADPNVFTYSSGTTVSQWNDKSGSGYHMTVKAGSVGPTRNVICNGRMVLGFSTNMVLQNTSINLATSANTVFVVSRYSQTANTGALQRILTSTGNNWLLGHWNTYYNQYYAEGWVQYAGYSYDTTWRMYMGDWSGSGTDQANFYSNGTRIITNSNGASAGPNGISINASEPSICEVAEIIVYNKVLTDSERKSVHTYLSRKWGFSNPDYIIYDESANGRNVEFFNGAILNSDKGGSIAFDGTNDYASFSLNLTGYTQITTEIWLKPNVSTQAMAFEHSTNWNANLGAFGLYPNSDGSNSNSGLCHTTFSGGQRNYAFTCGTTNYSCHTNIFCNTFDSTGRLVYVNGNLLPFSSVGGWSTSTATSVNSPFTNYPMYLASRAGTSQFFNTNIAIFRIYTKKLSASEVLQNFNATRGRFGI